MKQLFTVLALFTAWCSFAQNAELSGKVTDLNTKEPLAGASVRYDRGRGVITDANGYFKISVAEGQYDLVITSIGYKKQKQSINLAIGEKKTINFSLATDAYEFSEISTVSTYKKNAAKETVSTDVVTAESIQHNNSQDLGDALGRTSGVLVQDGQITIRGGSGYSYGVGSRTAVLQDGQSLMSADLGQGQNSMAEIENAKQIEVIKGPSSVLYGSSALNGVVNMVTSWPVEDTPRTTIDLNSTVYGGTPKAYQRWWTNAQQPWGYNINVNHRRKIDNLQLVAGGNVTGLNSYIQLANDWRVQGFFKTRYLSPKIEGLNFGADGSVQFESIDEFFISKDADSSAFKSGAGSTSDYVRVNFDPHLTYATSKGHIYNLKVRYMNIDRFGIPGSIGPSTFSVGAPTPAPTAVSHQVMVDNQYQYRWKGMFVYTAGVPFTIGDSRSNLYSDVHINLAAAAFSQLEFNYKWLSAQVGVRYEIQKVDEDFEKSIPVVRGGLNFEASKSTHIRASLGQAYRIPSIGERDILQNFYSGILVIPNDTLHAERGWGSEIGINQIFKIGNHFIGFVDLAVFYNRYNEFTEYDFGFYQNRFPGSGQVITTDTSLLNHISEGGPPTPGTAINQLKLFGIRASNIEDAQIFGYEFSLGGKGQIGKVGITVSAGYSYNYGATPGTSSSPYSEGQFFKDAFTYNVHRVQNQNSPQYIHMLEYRVRHLFRSDLELKYWRIYVGGTFSYGSLPEKIPATILTAVNFISGNDSYSQYFNIHKNGDFIGDVRVGYIINKHFNVGFIIKNVANRFYMLRPGRPEPIRNFTFQVRYNF
jgi:iron complex outermembrane receptor protein